LRAISRSRRVGRGMVSGVSFELVHPLEDVKNGPF
jgi:hypothetical protein